MGIYLCCRHSLVPIGARGTTTYYCALYVIIRIAQVEALMHEYSQRCRIVLCGKEYFMCHPTMYRISSWNHAEIIRFCSKCENIPTNNRGLCDESPTRKTNSVQPPMPANILARKRTPFCMYVIRGSNLPKNEPPIQPYWTHTLPLTPPISTKHRAKTRYPPKWLG